jgi:hypothetical protein
MVDTFLYLQKYKFGFLSKMEKWSVNEQPDSMVIGPAFLG